MNIIDQDAITIKEQGWRSRIPARTEQMPAFKA